MQVVPSKLIFVKNPLISILVTIVKNPLIIDNLSFLRWLCHKIAAQSKFIEERPKKITETNDRYDVSVVDRRRDNLSTYSSRHQNISEHSYQSDDDDFVGNGEQMECLAKWLYARKDRTIIFICGMGGLGKTTIASSIYKKEAIERMFICPACISVSQSYRVKDGINTMDCVNLAEVSTRQEVPNCVGCHME
jgi:disease resistance protein RPM1